MVKKRVGAALGLCGYLALAGAFSVCSGSASAEITTESSINAIERRLCLEIFWWGQQSFQAGGQVDVALKINQDGANAWVEGAGNSAGVSRWADFFSIVPSPAGEVRVMSSFGYNVDRMRGTSDFERRRDLVFSGDVKNVKINLPKYCSPKYAPETPLKRQMVNIIVASVKNYIMYSVKFEKITYPEKLNIVIANFDPDYPETFIYLPRYKRILVAHFYGSSPEDGSYFDDKSYPIRDHDGEGAVDLRDKIVRNGMREIINIRNP